MKKFVSNYANYNVWANQRLVNWLSGIKKENLTAKVDSSFESIHSTLQHIYIAQEFWTTFVSGKNLQKFNWQNVENDVFVQMEKLMSQSIDLADMVTSMNEENLSEIRELNMPWSKNQLPVYEHIIHCINHSTYHRGQIVTIARGLGVDSAIPNTDYNMFNTTQ